MYNEKLMYRIMSELYKLEAPIIFKGALVTNVILQQSDNSTQVTRGTKDIDADWINLNTDMNTLKNYIQEALNNIDNSLKVEITREYSENKSAGFVIKNITGDKITSLDISMRDTSYKQLYYIDDLRFWGTTVDKILADKISSISSDKIIRRVKDILDVYALSFCTNYTTSQIIEVMNNTNRFLGDFEYFQKNKDKLKYAYDKLQGVQNKVDFESVYEKVNDISKEFIKYPYITKKMQR